MKIKKESLNAHIPRVNRNCTDNTGDILTFGGSCLFSTLVKPTIQLLLQTRDGSHSALVFFYELIAAAKSVGSILPPLRITATFFPLTSTLFARRAATTVAADPSTMMP